MPTSPETANGFLKLSWAVWLRPPSCENAKSSGPPLVILCGWLGAPIRHLSKYAEGYSRILPRAAILIIQCSIIDGMFPWGSIWHRYRLRPAIEIIKKEFGMDAAQQARNPVLVHAFSNGGTLTSSLLLAHFAEKNLQKCDGLILDSCPSQGTYLRTVNGFIVGAGADRMPGIFRLPLTAISCVGVFLGLLILPWAMGQDNTVIRAARALNDMSVLDPDVPRLYIYSKSDKLVPWEEVVLHAVDAKQKGYLKSDELVFRSSRHCSHVLENPVMYWSSVAELVRRAIPPASQL